MVVILVGVRLVRLNLLGELAIAGSVSGRLVWYVVELAWLAHEILKGVPRDFIPLPIVTAASLASESALAAFTGVGD